MYTARPQTEEPASQGYYPGIINKTLDNGRWQIIRKLACDPLSSTWLAQDLREGNMHAIKIFTIDATESPEATNERDILQRLKGISRLIIPYLSYDFYEESEKGSHLCLVLDVSGGSLDALRAQNTSGGYLPFHNVREIIREICTGVLASLHEHDIVHNAVIPGNITHSIEDEDIREYHDSHPTASPSTGGVIPSQPVFENDIKWNDTQICFSDLSFALSNFTYARVGEESRSASAIPSPESLLGEPITKKTDIWMVGYTVYVLLTGQAPFHSPINLKELEDVIKNIPIDLENKLKHIPDFPLKDIPATVDFVSQCMNINPKDRPSELYKIKWVKEGRVCRCGAHFP